VLAPVAVKSSSYAESLAGARGSAAVKERRDYRSLTVAAQSHRRGSVPSSRLCPMSPRYAGSRLLHAENAAVAFVVRRGAGEVVEGLRGHIDQARLDERSALGSTLRAVLIAALPLEHGPGAVAGGGEAREDLFEIHLAVAEAAEAARTLFQPEKLP